MSNIANIELAGVSYAAKDIKANRVFSTFNDVIDSVNKDELFAGEYVRTLGYKNADDGGGGYYSIVSNNGDLNAGNLMAKINNENCANVKAFGASGDGVSDDTTPIRKAFASKKPYIFFPAGKYLTTTLPEIKNKIIFSNGGTEITFAGTKSGNITNCIFKGLSIATHGSLITYNTTFDNCNISHFNPNNYIILIENHDGELKFINSTLTGSAASSDKIGTMFGIWSDNTSAISNKVTCINSVFSHFVLNAVFTGTAETKISKCHFSYCHTQTDPTGGGCVDSKGGNMVVTDSIFELAGGTSTAGVESEGAQCTICGNVFNNIPVPIALQGGVGHVVCSNYINGGQYLLSTAEAVFNGNYIRNITVNAVPTGKADNFITYTGNANVGNTDIVSGKTYFIRHAQTCAVVLNQNQALVITVPKSSVVTVTNKSSGQSCAYLLHRNTLTKLYGDADPAVTVTASATLTMNILCTTANKYLEIGVNN